MNEPPNENVQRFMRIMEIIFQTEAEELTCDECFDEVDQYVDMLRSGRDPSEVLPQVKAHLGRCAPCDEEFRALIAILESQMEDTGTSDGATSR